MSARELSTGATREGARTMRLSLPEGVAWAVMVGLGETYFLADAIRLGASRLEQGLVVALPLAVGALGPALALLALRRARARRPIVVAAALAQALLLGGLAAASLAGRTTPWILIGAASLYQAGGQAAGAAWSSWIGDVVPAGVRGRWFALRNRGVHAGTCAGLVGGGLLLQALEPARAGLAAGRGGLGFALVFGLAALARVASVLLLALSPEPRFRGLPTRERMRQAFAGRRGRRATRQIALVGLMQAAVWVGSPYFGPFMLGELAFSYLQYTSAYVVLVLAKVLLLPRWGNAIDQHGARAVLLLAAVCVALVPLPWLWASGPALALFAQTLSGASWAGFEVGQLSLLVATTRTRTRALAFAAQSAANGLGQLGGTLLGALLASQLGGLRAVFAVSLGLRLATALCFPRALPVLAGEGRLGRRELALRVLGLRPAGGLAYRVIEEPAPGAEREDERAPPP